MSHPPHKPTQNSDNAHTPHDANLPVPSGQQHGGEGSGEEQRRVIDAEVVFMSDRQQNQEQHQDTARPAGRAVFISEPVADATSAAFSQDRPWGRYGLPAGTAPTPASPPASPLPFFLCALRSSAFWRVLALCSFTP